MSAYHIIIEVPTKDDGQAAVDLLQPHLKLLGLTAKVRATEDRTKRLTRLDRILLNEMTVSRSYSTDMLGAICERFGYSASSATPTMSKLAKSGWIRLLGNGMYTRIKSLQEVA